MLSLPEHAAAFGQALQAARDDRAVVVVLVHWGDEHAAEPNDDQREWVRWFAQHGVAVVAGSGPHVVQKFGMHGGAAIAYSLGNAVYPLALRGRGSGCIWKLVLDANGCTVSADSQVVP